MKEDLKFLQSAFSRRIIFNACGAAMVIRSIDYQRVPKFGDLSPILSDAGAIPVKAEFDLDIVVRIHLESVMYVGGPNKRGSMTIEGDADYVAGIIKGFNQEA